jgi:hypothetical protein
MKKVILTLLSTFLSIPFIMAQQTVVFEEWKTDAGSQSFFFKSKTVTDGSGNVYITGATKNGSGDYDILTAKYNSSGVQQWIVQYNGAGNGDDGASALLVDGSGNVFITGTYYKDATDSNNYVTIKYNSSGTQQWLSTYNGTGSSHDAATAMCFDATGNIYVTGTSWGSTSLYDYATVKYNSSGTQQWASRYNHNGNMDVATKIVAGSTITVSGASENSSGNWSLATVQYNISTGAQVGSASRSSGTGTGMDNVTDIFQDVAGNIYVTGGVVNSFKGFDYSTIKFNSSLAVQWNVEYNGNDSLDDVASSVAVDGSGNVYVTGYSTTAAQGTNYVTIKYNSSGTLQWKKTYNGAGSSSDSATSLVINASNDVIVTGSSINNVGNKDFYTIKYKSDSTILWEIGFDGLADLDDVATDIAVDNLGDIIVAGQSRLTDTTFEYATIKYTEKYILVPADTIPIDSSFSFMENRGQIFGSDSLVHPEIKYCNLQKSPALFFADTSLSYVFAKLDTLVSTTDTLHRVDLKFNGMNSGKLRAMDVNENYTNYFLSHIPEGRKRIKNYKRLVYPNIYNYIDLLYGSNSMGMKYYFVVKPNTGGPGGNVADIDLVYNGADSLSIGGSGELIIYTPLGNIVQPRPKAFKDSAGIFVSLYWQPTYSLTAGNHIAFNVGAYNTNVNLILQVDYGDLPTPQGAIANLDWSTYYGGIGDDYGYDSHTDDFNKFYVVGSTNSVFDFPTSFGALYNALEGDLDCFVIKFGKAKEQEWATYYGGINQDEAFSVTTDAQHNVFFTGTTKSGGFPVCVNCPGYQQLTINGDRDAFFAKLDPTGTMQLWSTFFGGTNEDWGRNLDYKNSHLYVAGDVETTGSPFTLTFPTLTPTGYNQTAHGDANIGGRDLFVGQFANDGTQEWTSLLGGLGYDGATGCVVDNYGRLYVSGYCGSPGQASCTPVAGKIPLCDPGNGAYCLGNQGGRDVLISKFDVDKTLLWSTLYGGTLDDGTSSGGEQTGNQIAIDISGDIYIVGVTFSSNFPTQTVSGAYNQATDNGATSAGFILKFNSGGQRLWSTYYSGDNYDRLTCVATDPFYNRVFIGGHTKSSNLVSTVQYVGASSYYWQPSFAGDIDNLIISLDDSDDIEWATYFGGSASENLYSINPFLSGAGGTQSSIIAAGWSSSPNDYPVADLAGNIDWFVAVNADQISLKPDVVVSEFLLDPGITSIKKNDSKEISIQVYPNPSNGKITINTKYLKGEEVEVNLVSIVGVKVYSSNFKVETSEKNLDFSNFSSGVYLLNIITKEQSFNLKLVKQ